VKTEYEIFIESKIKPLIESGFDSEVNQKLFDFQQWIVKKALRMGRYAIFADCGLGKSAMQIEWAWQVYQHTEKPVLILCPLAVAPQTIAEAAFSMVACRSPQQRGIHPQSRAQTEGGHAVSRQLSGFGDIGQG
jgi:reverse gyrase